MAYETGKGVVDTATREAIARGMDTPLSDSILDGVEQGREIPVKEPRRVPFALVFLGLSVTLGYLLGRRSVQS